MRSLRNALRSSAAASGIVVALLACDGDRLRPGPPELILTGPESGTAYSPDTIAVSLHASDASGLDSVAIGYLGQFASINAFSKVEVSDVAIFFVPEGLSPGQLVTINAVAADLSGQVTNQTLNLTVIERP